MDEKWITWLQPRPESDWGCLFGHDCRPICEPVKNIQITNLIVCKMKWKQQLLMALFKIQIIWLFKNDRNNEWLLISIFEKWNQLMRRKRIQFTSKSLNSDFTYKRKTYDKNNLVCTDSIPSMAMNQKIKRLL